MPKRVTNEDKILFNELYSKIGTYAGVAREVGFSAGTVKRYIEPNYIPVAKRTAVKFKGTIKPLEDLVEVQDWESYLRLSEKEIEELKSLSEELSLWTSISIMKKNLFKNYTG